MTIKLNERYPGRFNNPTAGYPQGSFKNRTTPTAKDGSYLEKDWANDKEGFFQSLLSAAGVTANGAVDAVGASQVFDALQRLNQIQSATAFTTGGSAGIFTLTPAPALQAYASPQRFQITFHASGGATPTINVSGLGAKNLKQYNSSGGKIAAIIASGQTFDAFYDGTDFVLLGQTSNSTGTTAAQFDNSTKLATTAFVNGAGFQFSSIALATATATLTAAAHAGAMVVGNSASAITLTLPAASTMPAKALIKFWNLAAGAMTLTAAGADNIFLPATNTTFVVPTGAFITLASNGSNGWYAVDMSGLGVGQAWVDLTGSRASGTTYTNSTGRAITVVIQGCNAGTVSNKNILVNGSPLFIMYGDFGSNLRTTVSFVVPNGSTYSATISTLQAWSELR